jgi:hypothetical protein
MIAVASPPELTEGQSTRLTVTIQNIHSVPIVPLAMTLYVRPDPTEYFVVRKVLGEAEYYKPIQATEIRHHQTLEPPRIEADHIRDANQWRHVPDSRFLHPRILLPDQTLSETFQFQAYQSYRRLLYCDLYYLPLGGPRARGRLFRRTKPQEVRPDAERYTEVFTQIDEANLEDPNPQPENYILYRPRRPNDAPPRLLTRQIPLNVRARTFTYAQAARRARFGARTQAYFAPADAWVFEYADDGTWFVTPVATTRLNGHYANLIADIEARQANSVTLTAPRKPDDKLLQLLEKKGYADPNSKARTAEATIPADQLLPILEQAESLGYTIEGNTWQPADAEPEPPQPRTPPAPANPPASP